MKILTLGVVFFLLVFGGWYLLWVFGANGNKIELISPKISQKAAMVGLDSGTAIEPEPVASPTAEIKKVILAIPDIQEIKLMSVRGRSGIGSAYILRRDGQLYHYAVAELVEPKNGEFYEGWLVKPSPVLMFFSTGEMTKNEFGRFESAYQAPQEFPGYDQVVITLEKVRDATPEIHVLEGCLSC